jgi:hypothetical protein
MGIGDDDQTSKKENCREMHVGTSKAISVLENVDDEMLYTIASTMKKVFS